MKGGVAAMCAAAWRAAQEPLGGEIIVALTADEEYESVGTRAHAGARRARGRGDRRRADAPRDHAGASRLRVDRGRRCRDARRMAADGTSASTRSGTPDCCWPSWIASTRRSCRVASIRCSAVRRCTRRSIAGGIGMSTYPDRCVVRLERRTLPGERARGRRRGDRARVRRACAHGGRPSPPRCGC